MNFRGYRGVGFFPQSIGSVDEQKIINEIRTLEVVCDLACVVGDLVYFEIGQENKVLTAVDNLEVSPVIGVLIEKLSGVTARVQWQGLVDFVYSGLDKGSRVWVGVDGKPTSTWPVSGYRHVIGESPDGSKILLLPDLNKTKLFVS